METLTAHEFEADAERWLAGTTGSEVGGRRPISSALSAVEADDDPDWEPGDSLYLNEGSQYVRSMFTLHDEADEYLTSGMSGDGWAPRGLVAHRPLDWACTRCQVGWEGPVGECWACGLADATFTHTQRVAMFRKRNLREALRSVPTRTNLYRETVHEVVGR